MENTTILPSAAPPQRSRRKHLKKDVTGGGGHTGLQRARLQGKKPSPKRKSIQKPKTPPQRRGTIGGKQLHANPRAERANRCLALGVPRIVALVVVILAVIGITVTMVVILKDTSVCSYVTKDPDADPLDIQICDILSCRFDVSLCDLPCPFGYSEGSDFCPNTCLCAAEGSNFEGDIQFTEEDLPKLFTMYGLYADRDDEISLFRTSAENTLLWDLHKVGDRIKIPYTLDYEYSTSFKNLIQTGQNMISSDTCLDFTHRTTERFFLRFTNQYSSCSSYIGRSHANHPTSKNGQTIKFKEGRCREAGSAAHEMMHALGFVHEHARPDRDQFVKIMIENIKAGRENNFRKMQLRVAAPDVSTKYDYGSIMHYSGTAFAVSRTRSTILRVDNGQRTVRQRIRVTDLDSLGINLLYKCKQTSFLRTTTPRTTPPTRPPLIPIPTISSINQIKDSLTTTLNPAVGTAGVVGPELLKPTLPPSSVLQWGPWGLYLGCTTGIVASCWLGGIGLRERACLYGTLNECLSRYPGNPKHVEIRECLFVPCKQEWREWGHWQTCSRTCGGGSALRFRESATSTLCTLEYTQARNCNEQKCEERPAWSTWTAFSTCSKTCGEGRTVLRRFCIMPNGDHLATGNTVCPGNHLKPEKCNPKPCRVAASDEVNDESGIVADTPIFRASSVDLTVGQSVCRTLSQAEFAFGDINGDNIDDVMCGEYGTVYEIGHFDESGIINNVIWERGWTYCLGGLKMFADWNADRRDDLLCQDKVARRLSFSMNEDGRFPENIVYDDPDWAEDGDVVIPLDSNGDGKYDYIAYNNGDTKDYALGSLSLLFPSA